MLIGKLRDLMKKIYIIISIITLFTPFFICHSGVNNVKQRDVIDTEKCIKIRDFLPDDIDYIYEKKIEENPVEKEIFNHIDIW